MGTITDKQKLTDDDIVEGQLYKLDSDSKWYAAPERYLRVPIADLPPELVEDIRNKADNTPPIEAEYGQRFSVVGPEAPTFEPFPDDAWGRANYLFRENGITYVGRGRYWSNGIEQVNDAEFVSFFYGERNLSCPINEWCSGHGLMDIERYEETGDAADMGCNGEVQTIHTFPTDRSGRYQGVRVWRDGTETVGVTIDFESVVSLGREDVRTLADSLHRAAQEMVKYSDQLSAATPNR